MPRQKLMYSLVCKPTHLFDFLQFRCLNAEGALGANHGIKGWIKWLRFNGVLIFELPSKTSVL